MKKNKKPTPKFKVGDEVLIIKRYSHASHELNGTIQTISETGYTWYKVEGSIYGLHEEELRIPSKLELTLK